jgi:hypothetical protein
VNTVAEKLAEALRTILPYALSEIAAIHDCERRDGSEEARDEGESADAICEMAEKALAEYDAERAKSYTLAEIRNGTGWPDDVRFIAISK